MKKMIVLCLVFMLFFSGSVPATLKVQDNPLIQKVNELNRSLQQLNKIFDEKGM